VCCAKAAFLFAFNSQPIIDNYAALVFRPLEADNVYEIECKLSLLENLITFRDVAKRIDEHTIMMSPVLMVNFAGESYQWEMNGTVSTLMNEEGSSLSFEVFLSGYGIEFPIMVRHSCQFTESGVFTTGNTLVFNDETQFILNAKFFNFGVVDMTLFINRIIDAKIDSRMTTRGTQFDLDLNMLRLERHIKAKTMHKLEGEKMTAYGQIQWDVDNDATKKIALDLSGALYPSTKGMDLAIRLDIEDRSYSWSMSTLMGLKKMVHLEIELPTTERMTFHLANEMKTSMDTAAHAFEFETVLFSGKSLKFNMFNSVSSLNYENITFDIVHESSIKSSAFEEAKLKLEASRLIVDDNCKSEMRVMLAIPEFEKPFEGHAKFEYSADSFLVFTEYKRGPVVFFFDSMGKMAKVDTKTNIEGHVEFKVPTYEQMKLATDMVIDFTSAENFEATEKWVFEYATIPVALYDRFTKFTPSAIEASALIETPLPAYRHQGIVFNGRLDQTTGTNVDGALALSWSEAHLSEAQVARVHFEAGSSPAGMNMRIAAATPFENIRKTEFSFDGRVMKQGTGFELDVLGAIEDEVTKFSYAWSAPVGQRNLDITLAMPNSKPLNFFVDFTMDYPSYTFQTRAGWGKVYFLVDGVGKYVAANDFEVNMVVDCPEMDIKKYEVYGLSRLAGEEYVAEFILRKADVVIANMNSNYQMKNTESLVEIMGTSRFAIVEPAMTGTLEYFVQSKAIENGRDYAMKFDVMTEEQSFFNVEGTFKLANDEKAVNIRACAEVTECRQAVVSFLGNIESVEKELSVLLKSDSVEGQLVSGIHAKNVFDASAGIFEQEFEVIMDEAMARRIGYKVFKNEAAFGIELFTPKRTSAMTYDLVLGADSERRHTVSVWADKTGAPGRKLEIITVFTPNMMGDMDGFIASLIVKHPLLPRNLEYNMEHHSLNMELGLAFHTKFDFDVFDAQHKRWVLENTIREVALVNGGRNMTIATELRSQGTGASIVFDVHGAESMDSFSTGAILKLKDQDVIEKELMFFVQATPEWMTLRLGSPEKQLAWEGRWNADLVGPFPRIHFSSTSRFFGLTPSVFAIDMNMSPVMDIKVFSETTPNVYYHFVAGKIGEGKYTVDLMRHNGAEKKDVIGFTAQLDSANLFSTHVHWKLEGISELRAAIRSHFEAVVTEFVNTSDMLIKDLNLISTKWVAFKNMKTGIQQLLDAISNESKAFLRNSEADESMREVIDIVKMFDRIIGHAVGAIHSIQSEIPTYENMVEEIQETITEFKQASQEWLYNTIIEIDNYAEEIEDYIFENEVFVRAVTESYSTVSERLTLAVTQIRAIIDERVERLGKWYETLDLENKNILTTITKTVEEFDIDNVINDIANILEENIFVPYDEIRSEIVASFPELTRIIHRSVDIHVQKIRAIVKEMNFPKRKIAELRKMVEEVKNILSSKKMETIEYSQDMLYSMIGKFVVFDIENGEIEYELPIKREFLMLIDLLRNFDMETTPGKIVELVEHSSLRSFFYQARALYSPRFMSARLNGYATMIGGSSFMTFDKKTFDLTGTGCQYLLARDFLNKDFAVAVNFDSSSETTKKSIIFADKVDQVEIKGDIVLVNNKPATLPVTLKSIEVLREGDVITVRRSTGAVLKCDTALDVCTFEISPFYAGRTMGLWGTFTNEIADDMMEPSGKFSKDLNTFVNSWKLNKSCKDNIITSTEQADKTTLAYDRECSKMFREETSTMSDCFGVVSPTPYYEMCIQSVAPKAKQSFARNAMLQSISGAYSTACKRFGFDFPVAA